MGAISSSVALEDTDIDKDVDTVPSDVNTLENNNSKPDETQNNDSLEINLKDKNNETNQKTINDQKLSKQLPVIDISKIAENGPMNNNRNNNLNIKMITKQDLDKLQNTMEELMINQNKINEINKSFNNNNNNNMLLVIDTDEEDENYADYDDDDDDKFNEFNDDDNWDDASLIYDETRIINNDNTTNDDDGGQYLLRKALERRRKSQADISKFWKCGKCDFLNHPSNAICISCYMPMTDIIHYILKCDIKHQLKTCPNCNAFIIPEQYIDHLTDCQPPYIINKSMSQSWYTKLTECEKNAITHVQEYAMNKSSDNKIKLKLLNAMKTIDTKYGNEDTLQILNAFIEWTVPITIRIHCIKLIPILLKDTHYRNLFEIGTGSGCTNQKTRSNAEAKMFGPVYNNAKPFERPKYGCLNVGLQESGVTQAVGYGDGYFIMNDTTVRWRTTMTIVDSFGCNGNCGTLKHCDHLLGELNNEELKELIEAALFSKKGGIKQKTYREIQIHGPVQLDRDIISLHVPKVRMGNINIFKQFCEKNNCKLVWF